MPVYTVQIWLRQWESGEEWDEIYIGEYHGEHLRPSHAARQAVKDCGRWVARGQNQFLEVEVSHGKRCWEYCYGPNDFKKKGR
jgi:hypothetical protein